MQNCSNVDEVLHQQVGVDSPCFVAQLLPQLMDLVRASRRLPLGEEHAIRRGSRDFLNGSKELGQRSLAAAHRTLKFVDPSGTRGSPEELGNFNLVIDSIDSVLEKVDSCLKEALNNAGNTGGSKEASSSAAAAADASPGAATIGGSSSSASSLQLPSGKVQKPQVRWRRLIDNERTEFVPRIVTKHNQKEPLSERIVDAQRKAGMRPGGRAGAARQKAADGAVDLDGGLPHPYEEELRTIAWTDEVFQLREPQLYGKMEDTPLVHVSTEQELREMVDEIKSTCIGKEIAVDLEHHEFRSYRGFTCLVQVSTRHKDWLVDPFNIFEEMHMLNEIFTDPRIVKVLHGADRDVTWLQRDFSVFIVNMFDTGLATRQLKMQGGFSLANLVLHYCGLKLDKRYQTADWRERPLAKEMAQYARMDTHYLLYCYDCLRNALLLQQTASVQNVAGLKTTEDGVASLRTVLDKSTALCQTQYRESPFDASNAAMRLCERFGTKSKPLEARQFAALQSLAVWRDRLARNVDESLNFISPDACLWRVVQAMPTTSSRLRSTCNPLPSAIAQRSQEIVDIVLKCTDESGVAAKDGSKAPTASSGITSGASPASSSTALPSFNQASSTSAGKARAATAERTPSSVRAQWPARSCSSIRPVVHVTAEGCAGAGTVKSISLASMFVEEDSDDDMGLEPAAAKVRAAASAKASEIREALSFSAPAPPEPAPVPESAKAAAEPEAVEAPKEKDEQPATALREAYALPGATVRKKKKKPAVPGAEPAGNGGVVSLGKQVTAAAAQATAPASFEDEAALLRSALGGAAEAAAAPVPAETAAAAPAAAKAKVVKKRKRPVAATAGDAAAAAETPAAAAADPYAADAAVGDPYAAASAAAPEASAEVSVAVAADPAAAAATGEPPAKKKKVKKIIKRVVVQATPEDAAPAADPYM
eukprot:TRINITY_DN37063_c0_g2_i1.p1 TRINITY_DN37063_c0_g2~~TRINITY_DN37063_c0_g2_i1.p1  ORF type:complete len:935 (+),score=298.06 TRINITY_DN37063_c0_g2_i1:121-2925(+)